MSGAQHGPAGPVAAARLLRGLRPDGAPLSLPEHLALHGPLPGFGGRAGRAGLVEELERSGLRGRGGGNFPVARKLAAVASGRGPKVVVANGAEGEPASAKDKLLLSRAPHLVLDGLEVAAAAVGASSALVATKAPLAPLVQAAVAERGPARPGRLVPQVVVVPDRFLAGESAALVDYLNGGPGLPTFVPPRPDQKGVGGRPTLVQNVETLAHTALVARYGWQWFRQVGVEEEPGTTLVTLRGALGRPGVYEVPRGTTLDQVVALAGGLTEDVQAFLVGGYGGAWLGASQAWRSPLAETWMAALGGTLGAGIVLALPARSCGVAETARILSYLAREGAGQCGPCANGLPAMAQAMGELARGTARRDVLARLELWAWQVSGRGACHHPDGAVRALRSALSVFAPDVAAHVAHRPCATAPDAGATSPGWPAAAAAQVRLGATRGGPAVAGTRAPRAPGGRP